MSEETLNRLVQEAKQRILYFINLCAGQHLRAMRKTSNKE